MFARLGGRRSGCWLAGLSFTGALWCGLGLAKVEAFEAYSMRPALGASTLAAWLRLVAPFLIGLIVLPVEIVFVFMVQIGRGIDAVPWWITLATIGAVLLSIAVVSEQRSGRQPGLMARVRDLV